MRYTAIVRQSRTTYVEFDDDQIAEGDTPEQAASEWAFEQNEWDIHDEEVEIIAIAESADADS